MKTDWKKIFCDILKYALGAVVGGLGTALTGCAFIPVLDF